MDNIAAFITGIICGLLISLINLTPVNPDVMVIAQEACHEYGGPTIIYVGSTHYSWNQEASIKCADGRMVVFPSGWKLK